MANGIRLSALRKEITKYQKAYSQSDLSRESGEHPLNGDPGGNSLGGEPFGLNLDLSVDTQYRAVPLETWKKIIQHYSFFKKPPIADVRDSGEYAKALAGRVAWEFGLNGAAYVTDYGPCVSAQGNSYEYDRNHKNARCYNLLLVRSLEWDERKDRLRKALSWDDQSKTDWEVYQRIEEELGEPPEPLQEERVFFYMYDPMENRFYYEPDLEAPTDYSFPLETRLSRYGYNPRIPFKVDKNHQMRFGTVTFG